MSKYILREDRYDWLDRETALALARRILRNEKHLGRVAIRQGTYVEGETVGCPAIVFQVELQPTADAVEAQAGDCEPTNVSHPCPPLC